MSKAKLKTIARDAIITKRRQVPLLVERGEDGFYIVECPLFDGCYSQGRTIDEALKNIREVILMILEDRGAKDVLKNYKPRELSLHTITV